MAKFGSETMKLYTMRMIERENPEEGFEIQYLGTSPEDATAYANGEWEEFIVVSVKAEP